MDLEATVAELAPGLLRYCRGRLALLLVTVAGRAVAEAARVLAIGESALKMRLSRGRKRLTEMSARRHE